MTFWASGCLLVSKVIGNVKKGNTDYSSKLVQLKHTTFKLKQTSHLVKFLSSLVIKSV